MSETETKKRAKLLDCELRLDTEAEPPVCANLLWLTSLRNHARISVLRALTYEGSCPYKAVLGDLDDLRCCPPLAAAT